MSDIQRSWSVLIFGLVLCCSASCQQKVPDTPVRAVARTAPDSVPADSAQSNMAPSPSAEAPPEPPAVSCPGSKIASDGVHCCWKGQEWSDEHEACVGKPLDCPDAHEALCNACVPVATLSPMVKVSAGRAALSAYRCPQTASVRSAPVHYVPGFEIDQSEVTLAQWMYFMASTAEEAASKKGETCVLKAINRSTKCSQGSDEAVNCVGYYNARRYCAWAGLSLPSAKQWDRALSAGGAWWKQYSDDDWYCKPEEHAGSCPTNEFPKDVTPLGITGMYGGVSEWTKSRKRLVAKSCRLSSDPLFDNSVMSREQPPSTTSLHCYAGVCTEELGRDLKGLTGIRCAR